MTNPEPRPRRQVGLYLDVTFQLPERAKLPRLDGWLEDVLEIPVGPPQLAPGLALAAPERAAAAWLWRALLLAREWLQIGGMPVFDLPGITSLAANPDTPGKWNARVRLALVENLPHALYFDVVNGALRLCAWAAMNPAGPQNRQTLFAAIVTYARQRLMRAAANGKSTLPVLLVAYQMNIPFIHLGGGVFQLGWGKNARRLDRSVTGADPAIGEKLAQHKLLTAALLRAGGLPAPVHQAVATADDAAAAARRLGWPVVVKPAARDRGEGVTTEVADETALRDAFATAAKAGGPGGLVIVERQAPGLCHRLFVAHGGVLFAVKRWPMSVRGDGVLTVAELIAREVAAQQRRPPWKRTEIRPLDEPARLAMAKAGFSPEAVPESGVLVPLRGIETTESGGVSEDVTDIVHPDNVRIALQAAGLVGLRVAGVDLISGDIARPWHETGAIINEVNFAPRIGSGEISRRRLPAFLAGLVAGNGRIPVHVFVGGDPAWRAALQEWRKLVAAGTAAYLTSEMKTIAPSGEEWRMNLTGAAARSRALLLSARVGAIILAVRHEEFRHSGLPFDSVDTLTHVGAGPETRPRERPAARAGLGALLDAPA
jgi:D-alanine-D-alanine ligase-like ATP-grasp enzyme